MSGAGTDYTLTATLGLYKPIANMAVGLWGICGTPTPTPSMPPFTSHPAVAPFCRSRVPYRIRANDVQRDHRIHRAAQLHSDQTARLLAQRKTAPLMSPMCWTLALILLAPPTARPQSTRQSLPDEQYGCLKDSYRADSALNVGSGCHLYGDGRGFTNILVDQAFSSSALGVIVLTGVEDQSPIVSDLRIVFAQPPDTVTTTTAASSVGATTITVASTAGIALNNCVQDRTATAAIQPLTTVTAIVGNVITLSLPIVAPGVGTADSVHFGPSRANFKTLAGGGTSGQGGSGVMYPPGIISNGSNRFKIARIRMDAAWDGINAGSWGGGW